MRDELFDQYKREGRGNLNALLVSNFSPHASSPGPTRGKFRVQANACARYVSNQGKQPALSCARLLPLLSATDKFSASSEPRTPLSLVYETMVIASGMRVTFSRALKAWRTRKCTSLAELNLEHCFFARVRLGVFGHRHHMYCDTGKSYFSRHSPLSREKLRRISKI